MQLIKDGRITIIMKFIYSTGHILIQFDTYDPYKILLLSQIKKHLESFSEEPQSSDSDAKI